MPRAVPHPAGFYLVLLAGLACRQPREQSAAKIAISADDLQKSYIADARAAHARFEGSDLTIEGEVVRALPRFRGTTMQGDVTDFDVPDSLQLWAIDPRIRAGETLRVSCPQAEIRWSEPAVYVSDCSIAGD